MIIVTVTAAAVFQRGGDNNIASANTEDRVRIKMASMEAEEYKPIDRIDSILLYSLENRLKQNRDLKVMAQAASPDPLVGHPPFPESEWGNVDHVMGCESTWGQDPDTYNLEAANGGRMQIEHRTWADFFLKTENWTWADIVLDDNINMKAAYIIWSRAGSYQPWPNCQP